MVHSVSLVFLVPEVPQVILDTREQLVPEEREVTLDYREPTGPRGPKGYK